VLGTAFVINMTGTARTAKSTMAVIGSRSVKTAKTGRSRNYDAGKKVKDRKHHVMADAECNMPGATRSVIVDE